MSSPVSSKSDRRRDRPEHPHPSGTRWMIHDFKYLIWMFVCLGFGIGIIHYPMIAFTAAKRGLLTWWEIVLPSQLPFFIVSELLMGIGFVALFGVLLEPLMRPLFDLPGCAGLIIAVSLASGFPLCAMLSAQLRNDRLCTRDEGERLMAFTSNASPLFMLGAISVGMYRNPAFGPLIAGIHYLSNLLCGILLRFRPQTLSGPKPDRHLEQSLATRVFSVLRSSRPGKQNFGSLLGASVQKTCITVLMIGAFITIFSVAIGIMEATGFFNAMITALTPAFALFHIDTRLLRGLLYGLFEITIGINEVSKSSASFIQQLVIIEVLLAWNGLAIQAQVAGMVAGSDLRLGTYLKTRCLQVPMAVLIAFLVRSLPGLGYLVHLPAPHSGGVSTGQGVVLAAVSSAALRLPRLSGLALPAALILVLFTGFTLYKWRRRLKKIIVIH